MKPRSDGLLAKTSFGTPVSAAASATLKAPITFEANCTSSAYSPGSVMADRCTTTSAPLSAPTTWPRSR
jgi:hypothetical protein